MSEAEQEVVEKIRHLLSMQQLAVLSTQRDGHPYSSLMAYAYTPDLKSIIVATGKSTRKHQNILQEARVSLLIDNRTNSINDFHEAEALTVLGKTEIIEESDRSEFQILYLNRHPYLEKFLTSPSTAFLKINVYHYLLVSRFQNVMEYTVQDGYDLFT